MQMNVIIMSLLAGVAGMGLGGLFTAFFGSRTDKMVSIFLSFAGGVMVSIVFLELIPEAVEYSIAVAIIGLVAGAALVWGLNHVMDKISNAGKEKHDLHETYAEFFHSDDMLLRKKSMLRSGMIMLFAIGLHNIPEGLALGAIGINDIGLGIALAIVIALHNIPEGMAVSAPLMAGGMSKAKSVMLTLTAGSTTVIGAVVGVIIGSISDLAVAVSVAVAGGAMLYVVLGEIIPQSILMSKSRVPTVFALAGIIFGMLFMELVEYAEKLIA